MDLTKAVSIVFQYGGTTIMAALFIWAYIEDRKKNSKMMEDNTETLRLLTESTNVLKESNNNIAKSLDIISNTLGTINEKSDRNYQELLKGEYKK